MSSKPEGAGWLESSVEDRYASMKAIPSTKSRGDHPNMKPVGDKAGTAHGFKRSGTMAGDTADGATKR